VVCRICKAVGDEIAASTIIVYLKEPGKGGTSGKFYIPYTTKPRNTPSYIEIGHVLAEVMFTDIRQTDRQTDKGQTIMVFAATNRRRRRADITPRADYVVCTYSEWSYVHFCSRCEVNTSVTVEQSFLCVHYALSCLSRAHRELETERHTTFKLRDEQCSILRILRFFSKFKKRVFSCFEMTCQNT